MHVLMAFLSPAYAETYAVDFVAAAADASLINDAGDVVGTRYIDPGCGSFCLADSEVVVWIDGEPVELPAHPTLDGIVVTAINADGWIAGYVGSTDFQANAAVWIPNGVGYDLIDLGTLPGTDVAYAGGIDDSGRVVGWSTTGGAIPTLTGAFVWDETSGMQDISDAGFPNEWPFDVSPAGMVTTPNYWYSIDDVSTVTAFASPPRGYSNGNYGGVINDLGEQARFLVTTGSSSLIYPFRYATDGTWTALSSVGTGSMSRAGLGGITADGDVTGTISSSGFIALGPTGAATSFTGMLSAAYPSLAVSSAGPMTSGGDILASVSIGLSDRVGVLTPVTACSSSCLRVKSLALTSKFVQDPAHPGSCTETGKAFNASRATITVTGEAGKVLKNATVTGHWMDQYWTDTEVTGTTNTKGQITFTQKGLCGVGAVSFIVTDVALGARTLDRTTGVLTAYVIPS